MTAPDLLAALDAAAEDLAHARRAVAAAGRTEDPAARRALRAEAREAVAALAGRAFVVHTDLVLGGTGEAA